MRIWDLPPKRLCRQHLLGEHRELHGLWNILTKHNRKGGYSSHPETKRWVGKLAALWNRHKSLVHEMKTRSYNHKSVLDRKYVKGELLRQDIFINTKIEQEQLLKNKPCSCPIN